MTTAQLEKEILFYLKGLPNEALQEVIDYVQFLNLKKKRKNCDNLTEDLGNLGRYQTTHLEEEFKDYKKLFPREG